MRINNGIRRRLAPLLENSRPIGSNCSPSLLLSLPGTPVIYYGDEIGMGDNVYLGDRNGVRTPMQWTGDRNAGLLARRPGPAVLAGGHRSGVRLSGRQRRGAGALAALAAELDAPDDRAPPAAPRCSAAGTMDDHPPGESRDPRVRPRAGRRRPDPRRRQPVAHGAAGRSSTCASRRLAPMEMTGRDCRR